MISILALIFLAIHGVQCMTSGVDVYHGQYNYVVSIQRLGTHWCSGIIIDANHILTAAHTVYGIMSCELLVVAGVVVTTNPAFTSVPVKDIYISPHFKRIHFFGRQINKYFDDDIAVLKLTESLIWTPSVGFASFTTTEFDEYPCLDCKVISWHYPLQDRRDVVSLKWDYVEVVMDEDCRQFNVQVSSNQKCFKDFFSTNLISSEDIGSPIVCAGLTVGFIVNGGSHENVEAPSTFMTTLPYLKFITDIINDGQSDAQPGEFPYVASIWMLDAYICGGVIIDETHVITAGVCVRGHKSDNFHVIVGKTQVIEADAITYWKPVSIIQVHPKYRTARQYHAGHHNLYNNIALLTLMDPLIWSPTIQKQQLGNSDTSYSREFCQVLQWKREYNEAGREIRKLKISPAILLEEASSRFLNLRVLKFQFAVISPYALPFATLNDIGNPIICGGSPLGIMVEDLSAQLGQNSPTIFLKIRPYAESGFFNAT